MSADIMVGGNPELVLEETRAGFGQSEPDSDESGRRLADISECSGSWAVAVLVNETATVFKLKSLGGCVKTLF